MQKKATRPHFRFERKLAQGDIWPVAGMDEVGRGPLAGPVAAAAVILDPDRLPRGVNDSKQLEPGEREELYEKILERAIAVSVAFASAAEIDRINIRQASLLAMRRALAALAVRPRYVLIDGNDLPPALCCEGETIIDGDTKSISIAAASIVAKVTRDRLMRRLCPVFPVYGFSRHVGYSTEEHLAAIAKYGPCPYHRLSFSPFRLAAE
ncbi:MAG TPA: ribonuclease HII [Methylovirgula sp.]|nr:ribonuclease HII [Methylovirgula sp.]